MSFIGRQDELTLLRALKKKDKSSLVVITGRRRIGKSALVQQFAKESKRFFEFQGGAPTDTTTNARQLKIFAEQCQSHFGGAEPLLRSWTESFSHLAKEIGNKGCVVFLDELSWMGKFDADFSGKLKIAWDTKFSKIPGLILVLCGSVSAWIEKNILQSADFVGRISLTIRLQELGLGETFGFWGSRGSRVSLTERLSYICVSGGIPKYLEEYDPRQTTAENIKRLCFTSGGYLFEDFDRIFSDIFGKRSAVYRNIVRTLVQQHLTPRQIAAKLKLTPSGEFTTYLHELEISGFVARDYFYKAGGAKGKLSKLRISDNYLRFYLKYIEPNKEKIIKKVYNFASLNQLLAWETINGLQFENLIVNRLPETIQMLGLTTEHIVSAGPYFQNATNKTKACQIDLLIECKPNNFYIIEIKYRKKIGIEIVTEMKNKLAAFRVPKYSTRRPVLIYFGELDERVRDLDYFDKLVDLREVFATS